MLLPPNPPAPAAAAATTFPLFPLLPGELRDLIWTLAAAPPPQIHFLRRLDPRHDKWLDPDMLLVPDRASGALNTIHLSLTCRGARAAVLRHRTPNKTILSVSAFEAGPAHATYLALDLSVDVICFGGADAGMHEADAALGWSEAEHVVFRGGRRLAVRYQPGWDVPAGREAATRHAWPDCLHLLRAGEAGGPPPFCARCLANVLRRFEELREFWLVVDVPSGEGEGVVDEGVAGLEEERRVFGSYDRRYFEVEEGEGLEGPLEAMRAIREALVASPRYTYVPPWAAKIKWGMLGWRHDASTAGVNKPGVPA
ncbi:hypothetical protein QBC39DRAFT_411898 [Podospora conica]|nr:hypothetical protein QBC39DRAFT_411898 [Schizothecium conicum]